MSTKYPQKDASSHRPLQMRLTRARLVRRVHRRPDGTLHPRSILQKSMLKVQAIMSTYRRVQPLPVSLVRELIKLAVPTAHFPILRFLAWNCGTRVWRLGNISAQPSTIFESSGFCKLIFSNDLRAKRVRREDPAAVLPYLRQWRH